MAVALGVSVSDSSCGLVRSALRLGWHLIIGTGAYKGFKSKFDGALRMLDHVSDQQLAVFGDLDMIVQQPPEHVTSLVNQELLHADELLWSAEGGCFPQGGWPYNLGLRGAVCEQAAPKALGGRWLNSGGYAGPARAVAGALRAMAASYARDDGSPCAFAGDQWYATALALRSPARHRLNTDARVFYTSPNLAHVSLHAISDGRGNRTAFCFAGEGKSDARHCPAFMHFTGGSKHRVLPHMAHALGLAPWSKPPEYGPLAKSVLKMIWGRKYVEDGWRVLRETAPPVDCGHGQLTLVDAHTGKSASETENREFVRRCGCL